MTLDAGGRNGVERQCRHARHSRSKNGVASLAYGRVSSTPQLLRQKL
jgi:hypothetical protein